ncbi:gtp cyclohydrolase i [Cystoisospora suis]|uniref:Gtp cyclohydrolase i n=1 Tax=Cystoisospora suis TaxID=483139 RepID=A0A2C6L6F5_9APIC|nr:gtp cyclohydrolase i [Cystoisospora suis]
MEAVQARGVAVLLHCSHMCMRSRGVSCPSSSTITQTFLGEFNNGTRGKTFARREEGKKAFDPLSIHATRLPFRCTYRGGPGPSLPLYGDKTSIERTKGDYSVQRSYDRRKEIFSLSLLFLFFHPLSSFFFATETILFFGVNFLRVSILLISGIALLLLRLLLTFPTLILLLQLLRPQLLLCEKEESRVRVFTD